MFQTKVVDFNVMNKFLYNVLLKNSIFDMSYM